MRTLLMDIVEVGRALVLMFAALVYIVSPIDLLPDMVPVLGWADDLLVFVAGAATFVKLLERFFPRAKKDA